MSEMGECETWKATESHAVETLCKQQRSADTGLSQNHCYDAPAVGVYAHIDRDSLGRASPVKDPVQLSDSITAQWADITAAHDRIVKA